MKIQYSLQAVLSWLSVSRKTRNGVWDPVVFFYRTSSGTEIVLKIWIYVKSVYATLRIKETKGNKKQLWKLFSLKSDFFPRQNSPPIAGDNLDSCLSWSELKSKVWLSSLWFPSSTPSTILLRKIGVMEQFHKQFHKHHIHNYVAKITPKGHIVSNGKFRTTLSLEKSKKYYIGITSCESLKIKLTVRGKNVKPNIINWSFKIFMTSAVYTDS